MFKKILFCFFALIAFVGNVSAAPSSTIYASANSIEKGSSVTVTVQLNNVAAWNIKIKSSGSTSGCDTSYADATSDGGNTTKYLTATCRSTDIGQIAFTVTGDATSADGSTSNISLTKIVTVTTPREKDSNNYLKSLEVTGYSISPEFQQDTLEYTVDVPSTVDKVTLQASAASSYASVSGTGEFEVDEGANAFEIKVTSETGVERIYKLVVNVKDEDPITISLDGAEYTLVKNVKKVETPSTYEATTVTINNFEIPAFYSEVSNYTLVVVQDNKGDKKFAIYEESENSYELYNENKSDQLLLYIKNISSEKDGFSKDSIVIDDIRYDCLKSNDGSLTLVYAMNIVTGKDDYYLYDKTDNTFLIYDDTLITLLRNENDKYKMTILYMAGGIIFLLILLFVVILMKSKRPKVKKVLDSDVKIQKIEKKENVEKEKKDVSDKTALKENNKKKKVSSKKTKEDAMDEVNKASQIIENYEKTIRLSQKELAKKKKEMEEKESQQEVTMYDIFEDDKKKKKKKK